MPAEVDILHMRIERHALKTIGHLFFKVELSLETLQFAKFVQTQTQTKFIQQKYIQVPYQVYMSFLEIQITI